MIDYNYPEHYTDDAWSAITFAEELKLSGDYDLFRGQRHIYNIQPSAFRENVNPTKVTDKLNEFANWIHNTQDLSSLHGNIDAIIAVAQHYGIKTPFLDFSYSPKIAGFFATDNGVTGDTGTIICLNKKRFKQSWKDMNLKRQKQTGQLLTDIVEIDVMNLWRLQAQEGAFLRCHVDHQYLEMFSCFLHIYFPQKSDVEIISKKLIYPDHKSHLEMLLDQYFLIDSYPEREKRISAIFEHKIYHGTEASIRKDIGSAFLDDKIPSSHSSWLTRIAKSWFKEPNEKFESSQTISIEAKIIIPKIESSNDLENNLFNQVHHIIQKSNKSHLNLVDWNILSENHSKLFINGEGDITEINDEDNNYAVSDMVTIIYSGMRYLPFSDSQISCSISRYLTFISVDLKRVFNDLEAVEWEGSGVRARGFCSEKRIQEALRPDFFNFIKSEKLNSSGKMDFRDTLYYSRYVKSSFTFEKFIDLFVNDLIPSQATIATEDLVINLNPMRVDVLGEC